MMISGSNIFDAWLKAAAEIQAHGTGFPPYDTQWIKKHELKELLNLLVEIRDPSLTRDEHEIILTTHPPVLLEWMDALWQCLDQKKVMKMMPELGYSYGQRIFNYRGVDQFKRVVDILKARPWEWRASISLYNPLEDDYQVAASPPCVAALDFKVRDKRLQMTAFCRAWDIGKKFVPDAMNLGMIQRRAAKEIGVETGPMTLLVASAHIYTPDMTIILKAREKARSLKG